MARQMELKHATPAYIRECIHDALAKAERNSEQHAPPFVREAILEGIKQANATWKGVIYGQD